MLKRVLPWLMLLATLLLFHAAPAAAEKMNQVYATLGDSLYMEDGQTLSPDAIRWWYSTDEKTYFLFMPGGTVSLRLWFDGVNNAVVDGRALQSGDDASFLLDKEAVVLQAGDKDYSLRVMRSSAVPAMMMTTESGTLDYIHKRKSNEETGTLYMIDSDNGTLYNGNLTQIRGRGNATFQLLKKAYQIKLEKKTDLCGMGKDKTWILLADFRDNSLLRNKIAFALARRVGLANSSLSQTVDVYINHDYLGAYLLCEKVEIGNDRVDITDLAKATEKMNDQPLDSYPSYGYNSYKISTQKGFNIPNDPADITGGYLLELDYKMRYGDEVSGFVTKKGQAVVVKEPEEASVGQISYISTFFQGFENAINASDGVDPKTGKHYSEFVDMDSLVEKYLLEEVLKNRDANRSSLYFYKPSDDQSTVAFAGPAWDYDASLGNYATRAGDKGILPQYFIANNDTGEPFYIFPALYKQTDFQRKVIECFYADFLPAVQVLLGQAEDSAGILQSLDEYAEEIEQCAAMNFKRWPVFNSDARIAKTGADYQENIQYLKTFLEGRMTFLEEEWPKP